MLPNEIIHGVLLNEGDISLEELARACAVEPQWIIEHVESGILANGSRYIASWRFTSSDLKRALRIRQLEYNFDAVPELAALYVDLLEEVEQLRKLKSI